MDPLGGHQYPSTGEFISWGSLPYQSDAPRCQGMAQQFWNHGVGRAPTSSWFWQASVWVHFVCPQCWFTGFLSREWMEFDQSGHIREGDCFGPSFSSIWKIILCSRLDRVGTIVEKCDRGTKTLSLFKMFALSLTRGWILLVRLGGGNPFARLHLPSIWTHPQRYRILHRNNSSGSRMIPERWSFYAGESLVHSTLNLAHSLKRVMALLGQDKRWTPLLRCH